MIETTMTTAVCNLKQAEDFLSLCGTTYLSNLEHFFRELFVQRELWTDFAQIENDIKHKLQQSYSDIPLHFKDTHLQAVGEASMECIIFNKLHDFLVPLIYQKFTEDDEYFFNKSTEMCDANITAEQLGAPENYAVPLIAAVVELSSLDNHKSPLEKLHCLCTTYDLIFAELKTALIDIISRFSDTESEIPVINNSDIIPILMMVIIKSRLIHLRSNFYYMETFLGRLSQRDDIRHVLGSFKEAIERLRIITKKYLKPACDKVCRDLDLVKLIKVTSDIKAKVKSLEEVMTPLDGQMLRITNLIVTSTSANQTLL